MINIEDNWKEIVVELQSTKREGIDKLIDYLETKTDFKTTVASTKFHLNEIGGLAQHSLDVLRFARFINKELKLNTAKESIIIMALLHDLCKTNYYIEGEEWDKEWKDKTNQWRKKKVWKVEDQIPLGHGEKSVIIANRFIALTTEEMLSMRWHMAWSDAGVHFNYPSGFPFRESLNKYPLVKLLALADQMAELYESMAEKRTEG